MSGRTVLTTLVMTTMLVMAGPVAGSVVIDMPAPPSTSGALPSAEYGEDAQPPTLGEIALAQLVEVEEHARTLRSQVDVSGENGRARRTW